MSASLVGCASIVPPRPETPSVFLPWGALRQDSSQTVAFTDAQLPPGIVMADLIMGQTPAVDLKPFRIDRF